MVIIKFTRHFQMYLKAKSEDFTRLYIVSGSVIWDVSSLSWVLHFHYISFLPFVQLCAILLYYEFFILVSREESSSVISHFSKYVGAET